MHIAIFVDFHSSTLGGIQTSVTAQRQALEQEGHRVTIFCPSSLDSNSPSDEHVIQLPNVPFIHPNGFPLVAPSHRNLRHVERVMAALPPVDIIHAQSNTGVGILAVIIAKKHRLPLIQSMHGREDVLAEKTYPLPITITWLARLIHGRYIPHATKINDEGLGRAAKYAWEVMINQTQAADYVVVPSQHFKDKFLHRGLTRPISVVSNGLDGALVDSLPLPTVRTGKSRQLKVMWCSRMSAEKRPLACVDAAAMLENCQVDMYGDGTYRETVQKYIDDRKLGGKVTLRGKLSQRQIIEAMLEYDVLIYSSYNFDNQPMVLLEAIAAGLPVVYCDPDMTECMPRAGALLTKTPDAQDIAGAVKSLQEQPERIKEMSRVMIEARPTVKQATHTAKMITIYQELTKKKK